MCRKEKKLNILIVSYIILVIADSATTYIGIKYLSLVELMQNWVVVFDYYGLLPGIIISTAYCLCFAWLFFKVRRFKLITYVGLSTLTLTVLFAVTNNAIQISSS